MLEIPKVLFSAILEQAGLMPAPYFPGEGYFGLHKEWVRTCPAEVFAMLSSQEAEPP